MLLSKGTAWRDLLKANQLEALALETAKDLAHESALDTIGLDRNERAFGHEKSLRVKPSSADNPPLGKHQTEGGLYVSPSQQAKPWCRPEQNGPGL